ncbi:MAG: formate dehydrogenase accessory protein FdhE [Acidobacteriota bacterium]|nr:formate dehydrogenase accessory protein FdhE [Acidobacteriota bacterium]
MKLRYSWDMRIERAEQLQGEIQSAAQLLGFYTGLLRLQKSVYEKTVAAATPEIAPLAAQAPELLHLVETTAPAPMAALARDLHNTDWNARLSSAWTAQLNGLEREPDFFSDALLQPYAEALAWETVPQEGATRCPFCQAPPMLAVMRPEGEGARRFLYCGMCGTEWPYRRLKCVYCGEEDRDKLPNFKSEKLKHIYLAGCDSCNHTLKCIDFTVDGLAVPAVDDLATLSLSLWARQEGYEPVQANLFGF